MNDLLGEYTSVVLSTNQYMFARAHVYVHNIRINMYNVQCMTFIIVSFKELIKSDLKLIDHCITTKLWS